MSDPAASPQRRPRLWLLTALVEIWGDVSAGLAVASLGLAMVMTLGAWYPVLDAINQLAPLWFAITVLVAGLCAPLWRRAPAIVCLAGLAVVFSGARVIPDLAAATIQRLGGSTVAATAPRLRLVTFNLRGYVLQDPSAAIAWVRGQNPDVVLLQEVSGTGEAVIAGLSDILPYRTNCAVQVASCLGWVLSRIPPAARSDGPAATGIAPSPWAWARFEWLGGARYAVMSAHTAWPLDRPLNLLAPRAVQQADQYRRIAAQSQALGPPGLILGGDFNSGGWSHALGRLSREAGLKRHSQALLSWPATPVWRGHPQFPVFPIDHVMAGSDWQLVSIRRGPALGSDHYPVVADFAWAGLVSGSVETDVEAGR